MKFRFYTKILNLTVTGYCHLNMYALISSLSDNRFQTGMSKDYSGVKFTDERSIKFPGNDNKESSRKVNLRWADTPGLADARRSEKAAATITNCIRNSKGEGRAIKPVFVVTLHGMGRIIADDLISIDKVMTSIKIDGFSLDNHYTVLVNQIPNKLFERGSDFELKTETKNKLMALFNKGVTYKTDKFIFIRRLSYLEDEDNAILERELSQPLLFKLLLQSPCIKMTEVQQIDELKTDDFEKLKYELNKKLYGVS